MNPAIDALARDLGTLSAKLNAANAGVDDKALERRIEKVLAKGYRQVSDYLG